VIFPRLAPQVPRPIPNEDMWVFEAFYNGSF
jgi:hypothetical protein